MSIYEGVEKLLHPTPVKDVYINYIVLGVAFAFEAGAWLIAFREFTRAKGGMGYLEAVRRSKDPALFTVLFEDTAAMLGLVVAFAGIWLGQATGLVWMDGAASIVIGIILAVVAALLAYECKGLLVGEGASKAVIKSIRGLIEIHAGGATINEFLTMQLGPDDVLVTISLDFTESLSDNDVERRVSEMETAIKTAHPEVKRVFIEAQSFAAHMRQLQAATPDTEQQP